MKRFFYLFLMCFPAFGAQAQEYYTLGEYVSLFNKVCSRLNIMYVDSINAEQLVTDAIKGMTERLDPYTEFYNAKEKERLQMMLTGKYAGIGSVIRYCQDKDQVVINYPYPDSPASEAGLQFGDIILEINDTSMIGKTTSQVSSRLRGEPGTDVFVKLMRPATGKTFTKKITRRAIKLPELPCYFMRGETGVIFLREFDLGTSDRFRTAFLDLKKKGMKKLVIDLRGNGGGSVLEACEIANMFIKRGELICQTRGKNSRLNNQYKATKDPIDTEIPITVLVDDDTASASEILAGCFQDLDRATIAGEKTYGKGITQQTISLPLDAEMKITVSKYYLPSGRCVQARKYNNGKEENVADSLTNIFYTRSGREVKDGSGIYPDIEIKADTITRMLYYLTVADTTEVMYNYVIDYLTKHEKIAPAEQFYLSDQDYEEFKQRVIASGFTYDPFTEKYLKALKEMAEIEGYYKNSKAEFEALEKKLKHDISYDLDYNKEQIKSALEHDIILGRYGYGKAIEANYRNDSVFNETLKTMNK